ncbi:MAG: alpha/beta fold hydrolase [Halieaceae bacterium]|uniref:alpha/beta fold hydrolase n=1 Tax=Haliea alexandrii TaxID=2448162 RepID=UPI001E609279|nr:alpha/beta fold hydrolase [Haliea alexandrii]MCR9185724.1 alpha/beta fold hydrolase [Halieaceae bacterium]
MINKVYWQEHEHDLGAFVLQSGAVLHNARLHYHQFGALNAPKDNLVLLPTYYGGTGAGNRPWVDDPASPLGGGDYCVIIPCLFGAGESSSPSNTPPPQAGPDFPLTSIADNVTAQQALLTARFGGATPRLVMGWSMGGLQALQWARAYPVAADSVLAVCATAKCYPHNRVFLEGVAAALTADPGFAEGHYKAPPARGLSAFATVYAGWAYSQAFFRDELYRNLGFASIEDLLQYWVEDHLSQDANDLLLQLRTWQSANLLPAAGEKARSHGPGILMPSSSDLYFTAEDAMRDAASLGMECRVIASRFGHVAGGPGRLPEETRCIFAAVSELLAATARE